MQTKSNNKYWQKATFNILMTLLNRMGSDCVSPKKVKGFNELQHLQNEQIPPSLQPLAKLVQKERLSSKIYGRYLQKYEHEHKDIIIKLLKDWSSLDYAMENIDKITNIQYIHFYIDVDILSARVYARFIQLIQKIKDGKLTHPQSAENDRISAFFKSNRCRLSYDRYFFQKCNDIDLQKTASNESTYYNKSKQQQEVRRKHARYSYQQYQASNEKQSGRIGAHELIIQCSIDILKKLYLFMVKIYLINLSKQREVKNDFIMKMERIQKRQQRQVYLKDIKFSSLQEIKNAELAKKPNGYQDCLQQAFPNYYFYKVKINSMLKRMQDSEMNEGYIQWMFPNHFKSRHNKQSFPLGYLEKKLFLFDEQVGFKMFRSIEAFLRIIGIEFNVRTLKISVSDLSKIINLFEERNISQDMLKRFMASLSLIGFRRIVLDLISFLNQILKDERLPFLKNRSIQYINTYGNSKMEQAKRLCFLEEQKFPQEHSILLKLRQLEGSSDKSEPSLLEAPIEKGQYAVIDLKLNNQNGRAVEENQASLHNTSNSNKENKQLTTFQPNKPIETQAYNMPRPQFAKQKMKIINNPELKKIFGELASRVQKRAGIMFKIEKAIMPNYNFDQRRTVYQLLRHWGNEKILYSDISIQIKPQYHRYYKDLDILSARVYARAMAYVQAIKDNRWPSKENARIYQFLKNKNFSYDRYFFDSKEDQYNKHFVANHNHGWWNKMEHSKEKRKGGACYFIREAFEIISQSKNPQLKVLFNFMKEIELFVLHQNQPSSNTFIRRLQEIPKTDQKDLYFQSIKFSCLQDLVDLHDQGTNIQKTDQVIMNQLQSSCPNYYFYSMEISEGKKSLHKYFQDYRNLEVMHDYIQWMFPNHYQSAYNSDAKPLNYIEKRLFLDAEIGFKILVSIYIFFDFLGIRLLLKDFSLFMVSKQRFKEAIIVNTHNHMRLMRILAFLSITGFRIIALNLIEFLEVNTRSGYIGASVRGEFERSWEIYGNEYNGSPKRTAKEMCFLEQKNFPEEHCILKMMRDAETGKKQSKLSTPPQKSLNQSKQSSSPEKQKTKEIKDSKVKKSKTDFGAKEDPGGCNII